MTHMVSDAASVDSVDPLLGEEPKHDPNLRVGPLQLGLGASVSSATAKTRSVSGATFPARGGTRMSPRSWSFWARSRARTTRRVRSSLPTGSGKR